MRRLIHITIVSLVGPFLFWSALASASPGAETSPALKGADLNIDWSMARGLGESWPLIKPSHTRGATVARVLIPSRGRTRLKGGGQRKSVVTQTSWSSQAQILLVLSSATYRGERWVKLKLAQRPNDSAAWFKRDRMQLGYTPYWVRIRTKYRTVTVFRKGKRVRRFRSVVGAPGTPTPRGLGAIYEHNRQPDPGDFIGPWAMSTTFLSEVLDNYGGGPGRVAIHGRAGASLLDPLGTARSHGCIRISNDPIRWIARNVPSGTPVRITG